MKPVIPPTCMPSSFVLGFTAKLLMNVFNPSMIKILSFCCFGAVSSLRLSNISLYLFFIFIIYMLNITNFIQSGQSWLVIFKKLLTKKSKDPIFQLSPCKNLVMRWLFTILVELVQLKFLHHQYLTLHFCSPLSMCHK